MKERICIAGDGLTGLTAALVLGTLNIKVNLVGPNFNKKFKDNRTTAISSSNYEFLLKFLNKNDAKFFWPSFHFVMYLPKAS